MGIKPNTEKQFEKQMVQRDFGVKGGIEKDGGSEFMSREDVLSLGEVICRFPGGEGLELGTPLCGSGDAIGIRLGDYDIKEPGNGIIEPGGEAIGVWDEGIRPGTGDLGTGTV